MNAMLKLHKGHLIYIAPRKYHNKKDVIFDIYANPKYWRLRCDFKYGVFCIKFLMLQFWIIDWMDNTNE